MCARVCMSFVGSHRGVYVPSMGNHGGYMCVISGRPWRVCRASIGDRGGVCGSSVGIRESSVGGH